MTGPELRAIRKRLNLTQEALAIRLGYGGTRLTHQAMVSNWEADRLRIPRRTALLIEAIAARAPRKKGLTR